MIRYILALICLGLLAVAPTLPAQKEQGNVRKSEPSRSSGRTTAQLGSITVRISGIEEFEGKLMIGLYDDPRKFPDDGGQERGGSVRVTGAVHTYTFKDVPFGRWAIAIVHDSNENGEMDLNWLGMPKEGYAFSSNAKAFFSAPDFEDASFVVDGDVTVKITMEY
jgi:uncharacterized protein (DUF2141 family)